MRLAESLSWTFTRSMRSSKVERLPPPHQHPPQLHQHPAHQQVQTQRRRKKPKSSSHKEMQQYKRKTTTLPSTITHKLSTSFHSIQSTSPIVLQLTLELVAMKMPSTMQRWLLPQTPSLQRHGVGLASPNLHSVMQRAVWRRINKVSTRRAAVAVK